MTDVHQRLISVEQVRCSVLQRVAAWLNRFVAVRCSLSQCVIVCCRVLQCVAVC